MTSLAPVLQAFFTDRLINQRQASPHTVAAYRDAFRLLVAFAAARASKQPAALDLDDLDAATVSAFLDHLQTSRGNSTRTRNARLAAIHSMFSYALPRCPEHAATIQRVLAIPAKRSDRMLVTWLTEPEMTALLAACDRATRTGRRDHAMLLLAAQTGLRVSELIGLTRADVHLGTGPNVHCVGKGRKQRRTPLLPVTVRTLRTWLVEHDGGPDDPLFPTVGGHHLSRDAVENRIALYARRAAETCPSIESKKITAHSLRHTAAMRLLAAGIDITVIALWLGHEQVSTATIYLHADMSQKEQAIAKTAPPKTKPGRYKPPDALLAFLDNL